MPRTLPIPTLVHRRAACGHLGISISTFERYWQEVFTDPRAVTERVKGELRKVFDDELREAVEHGGGPRARAAVLLLRKVLGRLT